jgi:hypothetical protein
MAVQAKRTTAGEERFTTAKLIDFLPMIEEP